MPDDRSHITAGDPASEAPRLRADAWHNRERILQAARGAFASRGLDVPMAAIARRAGVGVATLYRRFPTRESLVVEVFTSQLTECAAVIDDALEDPDPWRGFRTVIERICLMQLEDRGFTRAFLTAFPGAVDFEHKRAHAERGLAELIRHAQDAGRLRTDFTYSDVVLLLMANNGITAETTELARGASRRLIAYLLNAFDAEHTGSGAGLPPAVPLSLERVALGSDGSTSHVR